MWKVKSIVHVNNFKKTNIYTCRHFFKEQICTCHILMQQLPTKKFVCILLYFAEAYNSWLHSCFKQQLLTYVLQYINFLLHIYRGYFCG